MGLEYGEFPPRAKLKIISFFLSENYVAPTHFFQYVMVLSTQYTE